jgi:hypothetical protein
MGRLPKIDYPAASALHPVGSPESYREEIGYATGKDLAPAIYDVIAHEWYIEACEQVARVLEVPSHTVSELLSSKAALMEFQSNPTGYIDALARQVQGGLSVCDGPGLSERVYEGTPIRMGLIGGHFLR